MIKKIIKSGQYKCNSYIASSQWEARRRNVAEACKHTASRADIGLSEMMLCMMSALGSFVTDKSIRFASAVNDSGTVEGRIKHDLLGDYTRYGCRRIAELIEQDCRRFNSKLILNSRNASSKYGKVDIEDKIANMLDVTDEVLAPFINDISDYFWRKIPKVGILHPLDSWLLHDLMLNSVLVSCMANIYERATVLIPAFKDNAMYVGYFNFLPTMQRYNSLISKMQWLNDVLKPMKYNIDAVTSTEELMKVTANLRDALFSTKFIDLMFFIREGVDNEFRYKCCSLCNGIPYCSRLDVSKWLTIDQDKLKKDN